MLHAFCFGVWYIFGDLFFWGMDFFGVWNCVHVFVGYIFFGGRGGSYSRLGHVTSLGNIRIHYTLRVHVVNSSLND